LDDKAVDTVVEEHNIGRLKLSLLLLLLEDTTTDDAAAETAA